MLWESWQWLSLPVSGTVDHVLAPQVSWHGRVMVFAWSIAVPIAVVLARFFKVTPSQRWPHELDNKTWWHGHRTLNYLAVVATLAAVLLVWERDHYTGGMRDLHEWMGWTIVALALLQVVGGHFRGSKGGPTDPRRAADGRVLDLHGDHYDMTRRRILFERIHKTLGYAALLLGVTTTVAGLLVADAPRWMWLVLCVWWLALLTLGVRLQRAGRCLDTYQAIWGPDPAHPGNVVAPIGLGIQRGFVGPATTTDRTSVTSDISA